MPTIVAKLPQSGNDRPVVIVQLQKDQNGLETGLMGDCCSIILCMDKQADGTYTVIKGQHGSGGPEAIDFDLFKGFAEKSGDKIIVASGQRQLDNYIVKVRAMVEEHFENRKPSSYEWASGSGNVYVDWYGNVQSYQEACKNFAEPVKVWKYGSDQTWKLEIEPDSKQTMPTPKIKELLEKFKAAEMSETDWEKYSTKIEKQFNEVIRDQDLVQLSYEQITEKILKEKDFGTTLRTELKSNLDRFAPQMKDALNQAGVPEQQIDLAVSDFLQEVVDRAFMPQGLVSTQVSLDVYVARVDSTSMPKPNEVSAELEKALTQINALKEKNRAKLRDPELRKDMPELVTQLDELNREQRQAERKYARLSEINDALTEGSKVRDGMEERRQRMLTSPTER